MMKRMKMYNIQVDQFPFMGGEDCKPGVKGEEEWGPSPQVKYIK